MSLTIGTGPFGTHPAGRFNFDPPADVVYVERFPRRVRAEQNGKTVVDSDRAVFVHVHGQLPHYAFPPEDVRIAAHPDPHATGYVIVSWEKADRWLEEDDVVKVHPRDPYHRIDAYATSRHVTISLDGTVLADTRRATALYETGLPTRWYVPFDDVRTELLVESETVTQCAYKGTARHWSARVGDTVHPDVAWSYGHAEVWHDGELVRGLVAFYDERVDVEIDGVRQSRPQTAWSRDD